MRIQIARTLERILEPRQKSRELPAEKGLMVVEVYAVDGPNSLALAKFRSVDRIPVHQTGNSPAVASGLSREPESSTENEPRAFLPDNLGV